MPLEAAVPMAIRETACNSISHQWRNRIVGYSEEPPDQLLANPSNWRIHPKHQQEALAGVLSEVGLVQNVICNRTTGHVVDGHLRITLALRQGQPTVPVTWIEVSEGEEKLILATHDPLAAMAQADAAALDALLASVNSGEAAVQAMLAELAEQAGLYGEKEATDTEPQVDRAEELRQLWGVETGQLWQLGDHRLICGDCTDAVDVARVMGGKRAILAPVDPPYNVGFDYDGATVDDMKQADEYERFSRTWFAVCQSVSMRQIVTPGCYNLASWLRWFDAYHWGPWIKTNSMTNGRTSRFWCWEPVLFFGEHWGKKRHSDIFDFPIGQQKDVANHPCPKPLAMWLDLLENYSERGDLIYEAFSGSGTTLIACENLGRQCRAVEISPAYVAVALQRWVVHTGKTPGLVNNA
jgi:hypothetical protein